MDELNLQLRELGAAAEHVLTEIRQKFQDASRHSGVLDSLRAFAAAVDWKVRARNSKYSARAESCSS